MSYRNPNDIIGKTIGRCHVLYVHHIDEHTHLVYFECECLCGEHFVACQSTLTPKFRGCGACRKRLNKKTDKIRAKGNKAWQAIPIGRDYTDDELAEMLPMSSSGLD